MLHSNFETEFPSLLPGTLLQGATSIKVIEDAYGIRTDMTAVINSHVFIVLQYVEATLGFNNPKITNEPWNICMYKSILHNINAFVLVIQPV